MWGVGSRVWGFLQEEWSGTDGLAHEPKEWELSLCAFLSGDLRIIRSGNVSGPDGELWAL